MPDYGDITGDGISEQSYHECEWGTAHSMVVVYRRRLRDCFRKTYVLRCWSCALVIDDRGVR